MQHHKSARTGAWLLWLCILIAPASLFAQKSFPARHWGIGVGNHAVYTGLRFNSVDRNTELIRGINITMWPPRSFAEHTGSFYGLGLGLPVAMGPENRYGISLGLLATGAVERMAGIQVGGLATGANEAYGVNIGGLAVAGGETLAGLNIGGLATGAGSKLYGVTVGGLAVGAGEDMAGINFGGFVAVAGHNVSGISIAGLIMAAGRQANGLNVGGLAVGAGTSLWGINMAGLVVGAAEDAYGLNLGGLALGAGRQLAGVNIAGLGVAAPQINGLTVGGAVGAIHINGVVVAPLFVWVTSHELADITRDCPAFTGLAISPVTFIDGQMTGVAIGLFNYAKKLRGVQIGLLNYNGSNRPGLRWLPLFNAHLK